MEAVVGSEGCGCKGAKCDGSTVGCRNCYKMCSLVILGVNVKVIVEIPITMEEHVEDVNNMMKVMILMMTKNKLLKHYHL